MAAQPIIHLEDFDYQKFQWGYYFGLNTMDFRMDYEKFDYNNVSKTDIAVDRKSVV